MNACIVGFGSIGPIHAEALNELENVNLYAICDIIKERADMGAEKYGTKAFYNFDECIKDENIDCIHICTPHYLHFEMITKSLDAGKKVVVEKPITMKKEELDVLFEKYDVSKIFPVMQNRKNDCIEKIRSIIENDKSIGALKGVKGILTWCRNADYYNSDKWRGTKDFEGGGVLINQAIHTLDLMIYIAGGVEKVSAMAANYSLENVIEVEDTVDAYIKFKNDVRGIFYATNAFTHSSFMQIEFHFENKYYKYMDDMLLCDGEILCKDSGEFRGKACWGSGHAKIFEEYYDKGTDFSIADVKDTMYTMFAMYESAKLHGKTISI